MSADIYYSMLFTEQGMGNLVSITDAGSTAVKYSALIDFGSIIDAPALVGTIAFMVAYINANRAAKKPGPDLDLVVVSHQDKDHWNLFPTLIAKFPATAPLTIGRFAFGGLKNSYSEAGKKVLAQLSGIAAKSIKVPTTQCSSYGTRADKDLLKPLDTYLSPAASIDFKVVICNVASPCVDESMVANTPSLVVAVVKRANFTTVCDVFLPGDMTSHTISAIDDYKDKMTDLSGVSSFSIPHHGAHRTLADNYSQPKDKRKFGWAQWLAGFLKPRSLGASAGKSTFNHPYESVINIFEEEGDNIAILDGSHSYVSFDSKSNEYMAWDTDGAVFTNFSDVPTDKKTAAEFLKVAHRIVYKITDDQIACYTLAINAAPMPGVVE